MDERDYPPLEEMSPETLVELLIVYDDVAVTNRIVNILEEQARRIRLMVAMKEMMEG